MNSQIETASPRRLARIAGLLYLVIIFAAPFAEIFVLSTVKALGDAAATAANILASEQLFRLGVAASLVTVFCDLALSAIFYELMRPVSRVLALMAAFFRLAAIVVVAVNALTYLAPLTFLHSPSYAAMPDQLQAMSVLSLRLHTAGYNIALVVFGGHCLLLGYLITKSTFLPRWIGVLVAIAGGGYLINGFAVLVFPVFAAHLDPYIALPWLAGEGSLALWLLIVGLNAERWREQAGAVR